MAVRFCVRDVLRPVPDATFVRSLLVAPACFAELTDFDVDVLPLFIDVLPLLVEALPLPDALLLPVVALSVLVDALLSDDALSFMQSVSAVPCNPAHEGGVIDVLAAGVDGGAVLLVVVPVVWAPSEPAAASAVAASRIRGLKKRFSSFMLPPAIVRNPVQ